MGRPKCVVRAWGALIGRCLLVFSFAQLFCSCKSSKRILFVVDQFIGQPSLEQFGLKVPKTGYLPPDTPWIVWEHSFWRATTLHQQEQNDLVWFRNSDTRYNVNIPGTLHFVCRFICIYPQKAQQFPRHYALVNSFLQRIPVDNSSSFTFTSQHFTTTYIPNTITIHNHYLSYIDLLAIVQRTVEIDRIFATRKYSFGFISIGELESYLSFVINYGQSLL